MTYYIINNKLIGYEQEFDTSLYNYPKLNAEQAAFYEQHKCSLQEAIDMKLAIPYEPTLNELKTQLKQTYSDMAFEIRSELVPDYKLINAGLGVYSESDILKFKNYITAFRNEYYRLSALIDAATTKEELDLITDNYRAIQL